MGKTKTISRRMYKKIQSMYSLHYKTDKYEYRIDYFGSILRRLRYSPFPAWERFDYDSGSDMWKLVED